MDASVTLVAGPGQDQVRAGQPHASLGVGRSAIDEFEQIDALDAEAPLTDEERVEDVAWLVEEIIEPFMLAHQTRKDCIRLFRDSEVATLGVLVNRAAADLARRIDPESLPPCKIDVRWRVFQAAAVRKAVERRVFQVHAPLGFVASIDG